MTPRATTGRPPWRPFVVPALAVVVALWAFSGDGFDHEALSHELGRARLDEALQRLAQAPPGSLGQGLDGLRWWPPAERREALAALTSRPASELLESSRVPTVVSPLDRVRRVPRVLRLREAAPTPLEVQVLHLDLDLPAGSFPIAAGAIEQPLPLRLVPGGSFVFQVSDPDGALVALAACQIVNPQDDERFGLVMAAAHGLSPDPDAGDVLAGLVALHHGFTGEALARFGSHHDHPTLGRAAVELSALALDRQGLDLQARALLEASAPEPGGD